MKHILKKIWRFIAKDYYVYIEMRDRCIARGVKPPENPFEYCKPILIANAILAFIITGAGGIVAIIKSLL